MPLWKPRSDNSRRPQDLSNAKPRPHSCHINGVMKSNFPEEDNKSSFTLSQPAERLVVTPQFIDNNTVVLKHVLHKPVKKNSRVVRSISIGHLTHTRLLSKFRSDDNRSASLDNRVRNRISEGAKTSNGEVAWPEKHLPHSQKRTSSPLSRRSQKDQMAFQKDLPAQENAPLSGSSPVFSPDAPDNNNDDQHELSSLSSSSSPPTSRNLCLSRSSTSSIPSLVSLTSSDPPTPRSPSPADRGQAQQSSPTSTQDTRHASSSSSLSSTSPSPSLSPSASPYSTIVLSTNSPVAQKMGTQQLIPKGLASDIRQSKTPSSGTQGQGLVGLLGLDHSKRSLKTLSMVETGTYFSTGGSFSEGGDGESESPGTIRRGLRSTSYRRAVVSGVDLEVPIADPKGHRLSQSVIKRLGMDTLDSPVSPASPGGASLPNLGTNNPESPVTQNHGSPKNPKPPSPGTEKPKRNGKNKVGGSVGNIRVD